MSTILSVVWYNAFIDKNRKTFISLELTDTVINWCFVNFSIEAQNKSGEEELVYRNIILLQSRLNEM